LPPAHSKLDRFVLLIFFTKCKKLPLQRQENTCYL
jgi:hypothetical protein